MKFRLTITVSYKVDVYLSEESTQIFVMLYLTKRPRKSNLNFMNSKQFKKRCGLINEWADIESHRVATLLKFLVDLDKYVSLLKNLLSK